MESKDTTITICLHESLLRDIEQMRRRAMRRNGHLSRSGFIRWLLQEGISAVRDEKSPERRINNAA